MTFCINGILNYISDYFVGSITCQAEHISEFIPQRYLFYYWLHFVSFHGPEILEGNGCPEYEQILQVGNVIFKYLKGRHFGIRT